MRSLASAALIMAIGLSGAKASDVKILDIKAFLFWEHAGKFSDDVIGQPSFQNLVRGGGPNHESASAVLFDLTFSGEKNGAPKYATATVDIIQSQITGQPIVTHKAFANFILGADGLQHKALLVDNATCAPLSLSVHAGKTDKSVKLDFTCPKS